MNKKKEVRSILIALFALLILLQGAGYLLTPELDVSGTNWKSYKNEPENSIQVMFVGSSAVFCNIAPAVVYETSGITSYLITGPEQTMPISYYYIREACQTQKPEAIFVELKGLFFPQYGEHTIANFAFMPTGWNKYDAIVHAARREDIPGLLFPVLDFHDRWNDLTFNELHERFQPAEASVNAGFMRRDDFEAQGEITAFHPSGDYIDECAAYLKKIGIYCNEQGIKLYLFFAPVINTVDDETKRWVQSLVQEMNVTGYYDFSREDALLEIGLNKSRDWADNIHLSTHGAECFSEYLANLLVTEGIKPVQLSNTALWEARIEGFYSSGI